MTKRDIEKVLSSSGDTIVQNKHIGKIEYLRVLKNIQNEINSLLEEIKDEKSNL